MQLFGKRKSSNPVETEEKKEGCCCGGACDAKSMEEAKKAAAGGNSIKVLGSGCAKCRELEKNVKEALTALGMDPSVDHVTDFAQIASYGVMTTPALVVDGRVVSYGKVLTVAEAVKILQNARPQ